MRITIERAKRTIFVVLHNQNTGAMISVRNVMIIGRYSLNDRFHRIKNENYFNASDRSQTLAADLRG
jgi:hypothetical protein